MTKINVTNFENATTEEKVTMTVNAKKVKLIRMITCENNNGYADITVSYRQNGTDCSEFFSQTAKNLDLSFVKKFQMIINSKDLKKNLTVEIAA